MRADEELKQSEEYRELLRLKKLAREAPRKNERVLEVHYEYRCDGCGVEPIAGVRYHCLDCPPDHETDLCADCYRRRWDSETHLRSHRVQLIRRPVSDVPSPTAMFPV
jgi:hypothetical protein